MFVSPPSAQLLSKLRVYLQCLPCKVSTPCIISRRRANKHSPAINPSVPTSFQRLATANFAPWRDAARGLPKLLYTFRAQRSSRAYRCDPYIGRRNVFDLFSSLKFPYKRLRILPVAFSFAERGLSTRCVLLRRVDFILADDCTCTSVFIVFRANTE